MKRIVLTVLVLGIAGAFFYISDEQRKTTFSEILDSTIEDKKEIHEITIASYTDSAQLTDEWVSLTEQAEIDHFLSEVAKTDLKASGDLVDSNKRTYHIQIIHSEAETLSISTTGVQAVINNTRVGLVPDPNPVDLAQSYTIEGEDFFSLAAIIPNSH